MSNEAKMKLPSNLNKIDVNDIGEFLWWSAHLAISPEKLQSTIAKVGSSVEEVRKYIKLNPKP